MNSENNKVNVCIKNFYMVTLDSSARFREFYGKDDFLCKSIKKFNAIDSRKSPIDTCNRYNYNIKLNPKYKKHFEKCRGAFGCSLSHFSLYEIIKNQESSKYYCILEDDVKASRLKKFIKLNRHSIPNVPIINLIGGSSSTAAYLINPFGAELLLKESNNQITLPHDKYMFKHCKKKYKHYFAEMRILSTYRIAKEQRDLI